MRPRPERRTTLKERLDRSKHKLDDRGKHMKRVVKEKKGIAEASHKLRFPTQEGAVEIKKVLQKAAAAVHKEFGKQREKMEGIVGKCKQAEGDLKKRTEVAIRDAHHAEKAKRQMRETKNAKNLLARVEKVSKDDADFTNDLRSRMKKYRQRSEKTRNALNAQLMNAKLRLNW